MAHDRPCGGDRRRRPDRADAGGRAGAGGDRRRHRRAARQPGARRLARRGSALPHDRGARPARHRGSVPRGGPDASGRWATPGSALDISDFPTRHNYVLALWQSDFERILAGWVDELGVPILRGREVVGFAQDDAGVDVELSDGTSLASGVPRRLRRRAQRGPQGGRHRLRRVGSVDQLDDRRGRDGRGAGARHAPRGRRHRSRRPGGGRRAVRGRAAWSSRSTTPASPPWTTSARRSSPSTGPTSGCTARPGSPGSPT